MIQKIVFPPSGQLRARKVSTRSRFRATGRYPSWKMNRMMEFESPHELNAFRLLDCDPEVVRFSEQPCRVTYIDDDEPKIHYPDILVELRDHKKLLEIKADTDALKPEVTRRTTLLSDLRRWGYHYEVQVGSDLSRQPRLSNALQLLHFGFGTLVNSRMLESMRSEVESRCSLAWGSACAGAYGPRGRHVLCGLVLEGYLSFDIEQLWSVDIRFLPRTGGL